MAYKMKGLTSGFAGQALRRSSAQTRLLGRHFGRLGRQYGRLASQYGRLAGQYGRLGRQYGRLGGSVMARRCEQRYSSEWGRGV